MDSFNSSIVAVVESSVKSVVLEYINEFSTAVVALVNDPDMKDEIDETMIADLWNKI